MAFQKKKKKVEEEEADDELLEEDEDVSSTDEDDDLDDFDEGREEKDNFYDETYDEFDTGIRNQAEVVKIWLDTEPYLNNIYLSITNQQIKKNKVIRNGREYFKTDIVPITYREGKKVFKLKPLANNLGVSQVMAELKVFLSSPLVQGNYNDERYRVFMLWYEEQVTKMLWSNRQIWGIECHDIQPIYNKIVGSVGIYLTRTLGNLERAREKWNPNGSPIQQQEDSGFMDKIAFWRKKRKMEA